MASFTLLLFSLLFTLLLKESPAEVFIHLAAFDGNSVVSIQSEQVEGSLRVHSRSSRSAPELNDSKKIKPLSSVVFSLPDKDRGHNEAIVHWSGNNSNAIFILTRNHSMNGDVSSSSFYRSMDYGSTYKPVLLSDKDAVLRYYYTCPVNNKKLIAVDTMHQRLYSTSDEGDTWTRVNITFDLYSATFHPKEEDWILGYDVKSMKLYVTRDLGSNWVLVRKGLVTARHFWHVDGLSEDKSTVHLEYRDAEGKLYYEACAYPYCTDVTPDRTLGAIDPLSLLLQNDYIFVQKSDDVSTKLFVSYNRSQFFQAQFPQQKDPKDIQLLATDEHQVFLGARFDDGHVHLYLSDVVGQYYIQSLPNIVSSPQTLGFAVDFYEVRGLKGTFIANQYKGEEKQTLITFDKGGNWTLIPSPDPHCKLSDGCSLHIHLQSSAPRFGRMLISSVSSAPGMVFAHGYSGRSLSMAVSVYSYTSQDGGLTWKKLFKGPYYFSIMDHGGAFTAIKDLMHTRVNDVMYMYEEGGKWAVDKFANSSIYVDGVLTEPGSTTLVVSIFGHMDRSGGWKLVKLDFKSVLKKICVKSDYTTWTPSDQIPNHRCILGRRFSYERRKANLTCKYGDQYIRPTKVTLCSCVDEDFECDYGYVRKSWQCKKTDWFSPSLLQQNCLENQSYTLTQGYRKVASDQCTGGLEKQSQYSSKVIKCPIQAPGQLTLELAKYTVMRGEIIQFHLKQAKGSKLSTNYTWDFGDGHTSHIVGLNKSSSVTHSYTQSGQFIFNVTVLAENSKGSASAWSLVTVEDKLVYVSIALTNEIQAQKAGTFTATLSGTSMNALQTVGKVHYVWTFGDEPTNGKRLLTWNSTVQHTYQKTGTYSLTLEAINSVSSVYKWMAINIYHKVVVLDLSFSMSMEFVNVNLWKAAISKVLRGVLLQIVGDEKRYLKVAVLPGSPTTATVSLIAVDEEHEAQTDKMCTQLIEAINHGPVLFNLPGTKETVQVMSAKRVKDEKAGVNVVADDLTGVYIGVPVLLVAIFIMVLIAVYYRRKVVEIRRYSLLEARQSEDQLLDDDDDDPPLDPNPTSTRLEPTSTLFNDEAMIRDAGSQQPALVMLPGGSRDIDDPQC